MVDLRRDRCVAEVDQAQMLELTREYGIPCVMNAKISGIREGDRVEVETTGPARTAESYQKNEEMSVRVWKLTR